MIPEEFVARAQLELRWSAEAARLGVAAAFCCTYCRRSLIADPISYDAWHRDHLVPQSAGGGDDEANLVLACKPCNFIKAEYVPQGATREEWIQDAREYVSRGLRRKEEYFAKVKALAQAFLGNRIG